MAGHGKEVSAQGGENIESKDQKVIQAGAENAAREEIFKFGEPNIVAGAAKGSLPAEGEVTKEQLAKMSDKELTAFVESQIAKADKAFQQLTPTLQYALATGHLANMRDEAPDCFASLKAMSDDFPNLPQFKAALVDIERQSGPQIQHTLGKLGDATMPRSYDA